MSAYVYNILNSSKYVVTLTTDVLVPKVLSKREVTFRAGAFLARNK